MDWWPTLSVVGHPIWRWLANCARAGLVIDFLAMKTFAFVILTGLLFQSIACAPMKNANGQEVRRMKSEDFFAHAKETMSPEDYAKLEEARKQAHEMARQQMEAVRAKLGRPRVRMADGGDPTKVIWPTVEEYVAKAKKAGVSPGDLEKLTAHYKETLEQVENGTAEIEILSTDSEGRVTSWMMTSLRFATAANPDKP